jgi:methyltransferase (TIGR00027 family)
MTKAAAKTGVSPTVLVAIEQYFPEKQLIIEDRLAYRMLPFGMRTLVWLMRFNWARSWMIHAAEKNSPGIWGGILCRKRYIEEKLLDSSNQIEAIVNLGAGFDTLVYRLPELSGISVWELDLLENIKAKKTRLLKVFGTIPPNVKLVAIDLDLEALGTILESHGYSTEKRTFFILEAVTQYLTEKGIRNIFDFLSKAARGSRLVYTYILKAFLDGRVMYGEERLYKKYVVKDKIWLFGMNSESVPSFLKEHGWKIIEDLGYGELAERYIKPTGRILSSTPIERVVYAEKL